MNVLSSFKHYYLAVRFLEEGHVDIGIKIRSKVSIHWHVRLQQFMKCEEKILCLTTKYVKWTVYNCRNGKCHICIGSEVVMPSEQTTGSAKKLQYKSTIGCLTLPNPIVLFSLFSFHITGSAGNMLGGELISWKTYY